MAHFMMRLQSIQYISSYCDSQNPQIIKSHKLTKKMFGYQFKVTLLSKLHQSVKV